MTFTDLASIGSFVSGIAVVISLIYLALQVRHAQKTQRALMHQARTERVVNACLASMQPDLADVVAKMIAGEDLSQREKMQAYYYMRIQVAIVEDAVWQCEAGFLDKGSLDTAILNLQRVLLFPAARTAWFVQRNQLAPALRERIDGIVADALRAEPLDWAGAWEEAHAHAEAGTAPGPGPAPAKPAPAG